MEAVLSSFIRRMAIGPALLSGVFLIGCEAAGTLAGGGVQSDYLVARQALETGNYDLAITRYGSVMAQLDPVSAQRVQLEYAHALLRGNRFEQAIAAADPLIAAGDGSIRASALAVRGTARHEAARLRQADGTGAAEVRGLLSGARDDIGQYLSQSGAQDQTGSMRQRLTLITRDLNGA